RNFGGSVDRGYRGCGSEKVHLARYRHRHGQHQPGEKRKDYQSGSEKDVREVSTPREELTKPLERPHRLASIVHGIRIPGAMVVVKSRPGLFVVIVTKVRNGFV